MPEVSSNKYPTIDIKSDIRPQPYFNPNGEGNTSNLVVDSSYNNFDYTSSIEEARKRKEKLETYKDRIDGLLNSIVESNYQSAGAGSYEYLFPRLCTRFDRFNKKYYTPNSIYSGYTFITRPRLCLTTSNLHASRFMQLLNTNDPQRIQFAIRCMLDSKYSNPSKPATSEIFNCPYFDPRNPFLAILSNTLTNISGFPSQHITTFTTEGGFFSEAQRFAVGSDRNNAPFDLSLSFQDMEGGLVMSLFQFWLTYIDLVTVGECLAYPDDIVQKRLNYTVSIYRFIMDQTNHHIVKAAKCTGCFPVDRPGGAMFDISETEKFIEAAKRFTIQFTCNKYEEDDPIILYEFNTLVQRYCPEITRIYVYNQNKSFGYTKAPFELDYNFVGIPFINISAEHRPILEFRYKPSLKSQNTSQKEYIEQLNSVIQQAQNEYSRTPIYIV